MSTTATSKTVDKDSVLKFAEQLFSKQGNATTLEVKNAMRADGYWAEQSVIRDLMSELADEHNWDIQHGAFRTYSKSQSQTSVSNGAMPTGSTADRLLKILNNLFGIHKFAVTSSSILGSDLMLGSAELQQLNDGINTEFGISETFTGTHTFGSMETAIDYILKKKPVTNNTVTAPKVSKRVRVSLSPILVINQALNSQAFKQGLEDAMNGGKVSKNDWLLFIGKKYKEHTVYAVMVYSGAESRDHVRTAYTRQLGDGMMIQKTRACRIKNNK